MCKELICLTCFVLVLLNVPVFGDVPILAPGDFIIAVDADEDSSSPDAEQVPEAIDRIYGGANQKYLNFGGVNSGFIVTPAFGASVVSSFEIWTANDAEFRDPATWALYGARESIVSTNHSTGMAEDWTLIASGPVTLPSGRNEVGTEDYKTSVSFVNTTCYISYKMLFPTLKGGGDDAYMQIAEIQFYGTVGKIVKAFSPSPPDGATGVTSPLLGWTPGTTAKWHDVYLGTDQAAVTNATSSDPMGPAEVYKARQVQAWNMWYEMAGWIPGTTYYWRIDEVEADGTTIHTGDVWSFTAVLNTASGPSPADGAKWVELEPTLTWVPGSGAIYHDVYFGTDETEVTNGTGGTFIGTQPGTSYSPGPLAPDTTYYWRIDERNGKVYTGDVWSFTTIGPYAGALGYYYHWDLAVGTPPPRSAAFSNLVMTRIDPQIDFYWGSGSPAGINADQFAARWIADLEAPTSEPYTLWTLTDDGIRVWLNGVLVIENWTEHGDTWNNSAPIDFVAGQTYSLEMEYYENGGGAVAELHWSSPSTPREPIPSGPLQLPLKASNPNPVNGATEVTDTPTLAWKAGMHAAQHQVFFGTDRDAVADADTTTAGIYRGTQALDNTSYAPTEVPLEWEKTYYWKVNEVNGVDLWEGTVWSFTVADFLIIDDFEDYDDYCGRIFYTWGDGWGHSGDAACAVPPYGGNGTGSTVGYMSEPYAEQAITHDASLQSMPMEYLNDGSTAKALYSETERTFDPAMDFTKRGLHDLKALTLWFQGQAGSPNGFDYDAVSDVYTVTARSGDIWGEADSFHYVYKRLSGVGSIQAKVLDVTVGVADWTKVGVMIREDLEPNSPHAFSMLTPVGRTALQHRPQTGQSSNSNHSDPDKITFPYWVKIERSGNSFTAYYSDNGTTWVQQPNTENLDPDLTASNPANIPMSSNVYIGLALCSNNVNRAVQAEFSNVTTTGTVTGQWQSQDIGIASNDAERLYVALEDSAGRVKDVAHPDPNAAQLATWQEWNVDLADFAPVDLTNVKKMYIGVGDRNLPKLGGSGMLYIDDIRLYTPRCFPSLLKPDADLTGDCVVDYLDLQVVVNEWLGTGYEITPVSPGSAGLVAHYEFEGTADDSAGANHGTEVGGPTYAAGKIGQAIRLDGFDNYVDCGAGASLNITGAVTVSAWIRLSAGGLDHKIAGNQDSTTGGYKLSVYNNNVPEFEIRTATNSAVLTRGVAGGTALVPRVWYHVAAVYSEGNYIRTYVDGILDRELATTEVLGTSTGTFKIGCEPYNTTGNLFNGIIDELRIYNRVLSEAEIAGLAGRTEPFSEPFDLYQDGTVDFKDYAPLVDSWLEELLWP